MMHTPAGASAPDGSQRTRIHLAQRLLAGTLGCVACSAGIASASPDQPNILFFGNSFTQSYFPKDIPTLLRDIHSAAGNPSGTFFRRTTSGYSFLAHLQNTDENSVEYLATQTLPAGETWDYVVLQANSIEATTTIGSPAEFLANGQAIFDIIRASNPSAKAVLFETWARNENISGFYPTPFESPAAMQAEIEASYRQLYSTLLGAYGVDSARYAGVGDAFGGLNWSASIYGNDFYHANNRGELLIALTLYGAIHGPIATRLAESGVLDEVAASIYLSPADVLPMAIAADAAGVERGDTDLDWDVDFEDLLRMAQNYGSVSSEEHPTNWFTGDFDFSGAVDFDDLLGLAQHYAVPLPADAGGNTFAADWQLALSLVPEPGTLSLLMGAIFFATRARR